MPLWVAQLCSLAVIIRWTSAILRPCDTSEFTSVHAKLRDVFNDTYHRTLKSLNSLEWLGCPSNTRYADFPSGFQKLSHLLNENWYIPGWTAFVIPLPSSSPSLGQLTRPMLSIPLLYTMNWYHKTSGSLSGEMTQRALHSSTTVKSQRRGKVWYVQPDAGLQLAQSNTLFLVIEVADPESYVHVMDKMWRYLLYYGGKVRFVTIIDLAKESPNTNVDRNRGNRNRHQNDLVALFRGYHWISEPPTISASHQLESGCAPPQSCYCPRW